MKRKIKVIDSEISLIEAFDQFIQEKEFNNLAPSSLTNYNYSFKQFSEYFEMTDDFAVSELKQQMLYQYINHLKKEELAIPSINHHIRSLKTFFNWLYKKDYIEEKIQLTELKVQEEVPKFFKEDDLEKLLEKPRAKDSFVEWRTWTMTNFVLATGARESTLINIRVSDIDFNRKEIDFAHTKNKKALIVPLSPSLENVLKEYLRKYDLNGYLFPNIGDEQITTGGLKYAFKRYANSREVNQTNIHGLRHSFARSWVKNGGSAFALQKILGHSKLDMTQRYVRLFSEDIKDDFEDFSALDVMKKKSKRTSKFKK